MKKLLSLCMGAVLLAAATTVPAYPTLFGPTGTATLPTAETSPGAFDIAADFWDTDPDPAYPVRLTAGFGSIEVSALWQFNDIEDIWGVGAKYGFPMGGTGGLGIGALYTRGNDSDINATTAYLVYTHRFGNNGLRGLSATIGGNWTQLDVAAFDTDAIRGFASLEYVFPGNIAISAEYQTRSADLGETDNLSSIVLRAPIGRALGAEVGYTNASPLGLFGTENHRLFAGVKISFGRLPDDGNEDVAVICR